MCWGPTQFSRECVTVHSRRAYEPPRDRGLDRGGCRHRHAGCGPPPPLHPRSPLYTRFERIVRTFEKIVRLTTDNMYNECVGCCALQSGMTTLRGTWFCLNCTRRNSADAKVPPPVPGDEAHEQSISVPALLQASVHHGRNCAHLSFRWCDCKGGGKPPDHVPCARYER